MADSEHGCSQLVNVVAQHNQVQKLWFHGVLFNLSCLIFGTISLLPIGNGSWVLAPSISKWCRISWGTSCEAATLWKQPKVFLCIELFMGQARTLPNRQQLVSLSASYYIKLCYILLYYTRRDFPIRWSSRSNSLWGISLDQKECWKTSSSLQLLLLLTIK